MVQLSEITVKSSPSRRISPEALRRRLVYAQFLINEERFDESLVVVDQALAEAGSNCEGWIALGRRMKGCLELRTNRIQAGLGTLEEQRCSRVAPASLGVVAASSTSEDPVLDAAEDLRSCLALGGYTSCATLSAVCRMGAALARTGRGAEANAARCIYETWLEAAEAELGADVLDELFDLAGYLRDSEEHAESAHVLRRVLSRHLATFNSKDDEVRQTRNSLALALSRAGDHAGAVGILGPLSDEMLADGAEDALVIRSNFAGVLLDLGRNAEARVVYEGIATHPDADQETREAAQLGVAVALRRIGVPVEAKRWLGPLLEEIQQTNRLETELGRRVAAVAALLSN